MPGKFRVLWALLLEIADGGFGPDVNDVFFVARPRG
jgi:hypothetical protein